MVTRLRLIEKSFLKDFHHVSVTQKHNRKLNRSRADEECCNYTECTTQGISWLVPIAYLGISFAIHNLTLRDTHRKFFCNTK